MTHARGQRHQTVLRSIESTASSPLSSPDLPRTLRVPAALTAFALAGWIASAFVMRGMGSMHGPSSLGSFLWLWVAMCAAMMLPSVVPAASLATTVGSSGTGFVGGYIAIWSVAGVVAFEAARVLTVGGRLLAAGAILAAALYQVTPVKNSCLRRCRSPLGLLLRKSALRAGLEHGLVCLGCCWTLMLALLALGMGSLFWMAAVAAAIFIEKVTSLGARASAPVAVALIGAALWMTV
jgi:predicted metal-binding membrane protein